MNKLTALQTIRKGSFAIARIVSDKKPLTRLFDYKITKVTLCTVRAGIEYSNLQRSESLCGWHKGLPWGEWEHYPYSNHSQG